ncbi:RHS repeat-associated core domain-containing protein [Anaerocolumna jejuensis]|uniref:RHS repeat-associated core domain-containing protein n=1 Tax=Anaerocolumna jejuensis TaxID=259063 RepID=UPI003F7BC40D
MQEKTSSYVYDGAGNRVSSEVRSDSSTKNKKEYVIDTQSAYGDIVGAIDTTKEGKTKRSYFTYGNGLVSADNDGIIGYYRIDEKNTVTDILDKVGNVKDSLNYDEFGVLENTEGLYSSENIFAYTGPVYEEGNGQYFAKARHYKSSIGRFINEDSFESQLNNPLSLNLYIYCTNNPLHYTDPSGHEGTAFETAVSGLNVRIIRVEHKDKLIDYINNKTGGNKRVSDPITKFTVFSHGWQGTMALGYDYSDTYNQDLNFNTYDIIQIKANAFNNPASWFGSCNLGTGGKKSFGQAWVNKVGGTTWAFKGKTTYKYTMHPHGYSKFKLWYWTTRSKIIKARKKYGFRVTGSCRYPGAAKGAKEVIFNK